MSTSTSMSTSIYETELLKCRLDWVTNKSQKLLLPPLYLWDSKAVPAFIFMSPKD